VKVKNLLTLYSSFQSFPKSEYTAKGRIKMTKNLCKITRENLTSKVYQQIKEAIMSGTFQPGERLPIRSLAEKMGTSITPVREALLKLVSLGALNLKPAHPISVPVLNKEKYLENRTIRIAIEGLAAAQAAGKIKKQHLNRLVKINDEMNNASSENRFNDLVANNYLFHIELCKAADMPALLEIVEILWLKIGPSLNLLNTYINPQSLENSVSKKIDYHRPILDALEKGDSETAKAAMEKDLLQGGAPLLAYFEKQAE
jgi:DNA-binding GntR family transcriptional regulator